MPFDPIERSREVEDLVMRDGKRLYHKFRAAPYYGGIATADAVGCSFLCAYCWNYGRNENPSGRGKPCSPEEVAGNLCRIAHARSFRLFRITGSEPILGGASFDHFLAVLDLVSREAPGSRFILETNGLMLGCRPEFAERLGRRNLLVRIAIKGTDPGSFEKITGAQGDFFTYPLRALKSLEDRGLEVWPALMEDLFTPRDINSLEETLREAGIKAKLELEGLETYPFVLENLRRRKIPWTNRPLDVR